MTEAPRRVTIPEPKLKQEAPYPKVLAELVERLEYRPNWRFRLAHHDRGQDSIGLTLIIVTQGYDSYNPGDGETYRVQHFMPVPPAAYNEQSWRRWLLEQCLLVERHECCEFFKIDGKRPYAPHHGPGNDPYIVFERGSDLDARTMYTGEVRPALTPRDVLDRMKPRDQGEEKLGASEVTVGKAEMRPAEVRDGYPPPRPPPSEQTHYPPDRPPRPHPSEPFRKG